jgi:hypothetical protein
VKPLPWSPSSLSDFVNCPKQFYEKRIAKSVPRVETEEMRWGTRVHKAFEDRQRDGKPLPDELEHHEEFMLKLATMPGEHFLEYKSGVSRALQPCGFFDPAVWSRAVFDYRKVRDARAIIIDYKTGKQHTKFAQLHVNALHTWIEYPDVDKITVMFYWVASSTSTQETYTRADMAHLWGALTPDLKQYAEAHRTNTWQPRKSGLCNGWCPVMSCDFWQPQRRRR